MNLRDETLDLRAGCAQSPGRQHACALLIFLLLGLVGFGQLLIPGQIPISPHSDITVGLGTNEVLARSLRAGRGIPFWRADQFAGTPALTSPTARYTSPFNILFFLLSPASAMGWTIWFQLVMCAVIYYVFGHAVGLSWWPRLFMGVSALFSFKILMAVYAGWVGALSGIVLLPLLTLTVFRVAKEPRVTAGVALTLVGVLCLHTGGIQLFYYAGGLLLLWLCWTGIFTWRAGDHRKVLRLVGFLGASTLLALGSAAYLWLPMLAEVGLTSRKVLAENYMVYEHALSPRSLLTFLSPEILGTPQTYSGQRMWEEVAYFGLIPLVLSVVGSVLGRRRPYTGFLTIALAASILGALDTPLLRLAYAYVPGFRYFRIPPRFLFLASFFGIALAGIGLEEVLTRLRAGREFCHRVAAVAGILTTLVAVEGTVYAWRYVTTSAVSNVLPGRDFLDVVRRDPTLFRVAPIGWTTLNPSIAAPLGLQLITGYEPYNLAHYGDYLDMMQLGTTLKRSGVVASMAVLAVTRWDLLDALNVRYLLALRPLKLPAGQVERVGPDPDRPRETPAAGRKRDAILVYRNLTALARASWPTGVVLARTDQEAVALVQQYDVRQVAVVEGVEGAVPPSVAEAGARVSTTERADGLLVLETESQRGGFLAVSEIWHPGWRAWVDGEEISIYRTNIALMGGWIPPGPHRVRLEFQPIWWPQSLGISAVSWAAILGWMLFAVRADQRRRTGRRDA